MRVILTIALAGLLAGCTTVTLKPENPRAVWCDFNAPRSLANPDTAPRAELDAVNNHNDRGIAWCKWAVK
jgi:hypothetical protein